MLGSSASLPTAVMVSVRPWDNFSERFAEGSVVMPIPVSATKITAVRHLACCSVTSCARGKAPHLGRFTPSKAEFRLNDHQRLRKMLLGQEPIELPPR